MYIYIFKIWLSFHPGGHGVTSIIYYGLFRNSHYKRKHFKMFIMLYVWHGAASVLSKFEVKIRRLLGQETVQVSLVDDDDDVVDPLAALAAVVRTEAVRAGYRASKTATVPGFCFIFRGTILMFVLVFNTVHITNANVLSNLPYIVFIREYGTCIRRWVVWP